MCNVLGFYIQQWTEQYCPLLSMRSWNQTPSPVAESSQVPGLTSGGASSVEDGSARSTTEPRLKNEKNETEPRFPVSDPQWKWLSYDKFESKDGKIEVKSCDSKDSAKTDDGPFKVYYRRKVHTLWPDVVEISLTSPSLVRILQQYLPDHGDLKSLAEPKVDGRDLYLVLQSLKYHQFKARAESSRGDRLENNLAVTGSQPAKGENNRAISGSGTKEAQPGMDHEAASDILHAKHLVRFLEEEYKDVLKRESRMREEKQVAWDMLWIFLSKGAKVGYFCELSGQTLCGVVAGTYYNYILYEKVWSFYVELDVWDFDGTSYKACKIFREIEMFHQERHFSELAVCPLEIFGDRSALNDLFYANGKKFYDLVVKSSNRLMLYAGPVYQKRRDGKCWRLYKEKGDGRVMIDLRSFAAMNPDYPMGNARPSMTWSFGSREVHLTGKGLSTLYENSPSPITITPNSKNDPLRKQERVSDGHLIFAPAVVYGFSFQLKKWGCFAVSQFSDVVFNREAFQELNMEPEVKSLIHNLVKQYISSDNDPIKSSERVDPIAEKGEGCILLCHGPPGTGKTLTAESIAEKMGRPLWAMGVTELGTTLDQLEATLLKVLDIAARWKAVLLLDEADIYLEKRSSGADVVKNAMTGVFLRQLEYYRGILFLTTNRIDTCDDAFRSRISLFLHYPELGSADRATIWNTLLRRANVEGVSDEFSKEMAGQNLNGREIRNAIHTAQVWAKSNGERLAPSHIKYVVRVFANSLTALNQVLKTN